MDPARSTSPSDSPAPTRRGRRQKIEPGIYRAHRVSCEASRPDAHGRVRSCKCSWQIAVPSVIPGSSTFRRLPGTLTLPKVKQERRRALALGSPEPVPVAPAEPEFLRTYVRSFLARRKPTHAVHTFRSYITEYRLRIDPAFGHLPVVAITRRHVEEWIADLASAGTSRAVIGSAYRVLRLMLEAAVQDDLIELNPAARVKLPPVSPDDRPQERVLTEAQRHALLNQPSQTLRIETMLRAAVEGGLRRAELCGLRWSDVDFENRRMQVRRGYNGGLTKGRRSRVVSISRTFAERLRAYRAELPSGADVFQGPVWPGKGGGEMAEGSATQACARAMTRAGLVDAAGAPLVTLHGLRHTCASLMLGQGVSLIVVSRHLGHANPNITAQVYAHLIDEAQMVAAADAFEAMDRCGAAA